MRNPERLESRGSLAERCHDTVKEPDLTRSIAQIGLPHNSMSSLVEVQFPEHALAERRRIAHAPLR